ncbi:MAG: winged helix-turn-helix transcriptional regulator [Alphaproteobacteria bacterium]|jgi:DNA-binding MarR family transcriptional regulator|nr:winged helix-turn-helix transcriptional regulator [Alphaproteobacteria bacterium]
MPDTPALSLNTFLPYRLSVLSNAVSRKIADIYEREFDLSVWQWRIIAVLGESQDLTSTEVAMRTLMDKPTVSRAATSLIERGIISRTIDEEDRRRAPLALTDEGRAIYAAVIPRALACEKELLDALGETEIRDLHRLLTRLSGVASPNSPLWTGE